MVKLSKASLNVFCLLIVTFLFCTTPKLSYSQKNGEVGRHPAYSSYDFGDPDKVIVLGSQPLGVLHSVVPEIMKRDKILAEALSALALELRILPFYNGPDINHFMEKGYVDIAMAGDFPTLTIASSSDVELVAIVKRDRASVVSHSQCTTLRDLKNKRVGFPAGTSSHLGLLVVLEASGLEESDVKMVPMKVEELTAALVSRKIDAFAAWEPIPASAIASNKNLKRISDFLNTDFIYWTTQFAQDQPEAARHILAAYLRALGWLNASENNLTEGAKWSLADTEKFLGENSKLSLIQFKQQIRKNLNLIGSATIPVTEFTDNSYFFRAFSLLNDKGLMPKESSWNRVQANVRSNLIHEVLLEPARYKTHVFNYISD